MPVWLQQMNYTVVPYVFYTENTCRENRSHIVLWYIIMCDVYLLANIILRGVLALKSYNLFITNTHAILEY